MKQVDGLVYPCKCDTPVYMVLHFSGILPNTKQFRYSRMINRLQQKASKIDLRQYEEDVAQRQGFELGECPMEVKDDQKGRD